MKDRYKKLTLLHSNDMHGDFLSETLDTRLVGGVSMLSGYVNRVRETCPNTLYMIAGDMFRGSVIDSEFQGISTIEIMNALGPDIVSLGNHEVDYGIAHLLFLERCCKFPIVNANIYIKTNGMRLFKSHRVLRVDGMNILVIGIVTEEILDRSGKDALLGTFVDFRDAANEVGRIINSYKNTDIDLTVLLTHIGFESDKKLAAALDPDWGVDLIVGGHSHTLLEKPEVINGIPIVQAGTGTDQIGRFDLVIDTDTNSIHEYTWQIVPIDDAHCPMNNAIETLITNYKKITDEKYNYVITTLTSQATHPCRYQETNVGNLFCDILKDNYDIDLVMLGSGGLRAETLGPIVTRGELFNMYAYPEKLIRVQLTGAELKHAMRHVLSQVPESKTGHSEYYQLSRGFQFVYSRSADALTKATYEHEPICDEALFMVGIESYHLNNLRAFMDLEVETIKARAPWRTVTLSISTALEECMSGHAYYIPKLEGRTDIVE